MAKEPKTEIELVNDLISNTFERLQALRKDALPSEDSAYYKAQSILLEEARILSDKAIKRVEYEKAEFQKLLKEKPRA